MKHVMGSAEKYCGCVGKDLDRVNKIMALFKNSGFNARLPEGCALLQEVLTRFGTTFDVVTCFLKVAPIIPSALEGNMADSEVKARSIYDALSVEEAADGSRTFPALESITKCFAPLRHAQTMLEAGKTPTLTLVLPIMERVKSQLFNLKAGEDDGNTMVVKCTIENDSA